MAISQSYRAEVERTLSALVPIRVRSMFGGLGIYSGNLFFAVADDDRIYFKVDDVNLPNFLAEGMEPFDPMQNGKPMRYFEVPPRVWRDPIELSLWVDQALGVAQRASFRKKPHRLRLPKLV